MNAERCLPSEALTVRPELGHRVAMEPNERATRCWYRMAGLISRQQKDMAVEIIEAEIRAAQYEVLLEAAKLVLTEATPIEIARQIRERAERTIRPRK